MSPQRKAAPTVRANTSLRALALAAVISRVAELKESAGIKLSPALGKYQAGLDSVRPWHESVSDYLANPAPEDTALIGLAKTLGLDTREILACALVMAVEDDAAIGRLLAQIQTPLGGSRPTLALLSASFAPLGDGRSDDIFALSDGHAVRSGLCKLLGDDAEPLPERALGIPLPMCFAVRGRDSLWAGASVPVRLAISPPPSTLDIALRYAMHLKGAARRVLLIRSGSAAEACSVASHIAESMGRQGMLIAADKCDGIAPWLLLRNVVPIIPFDLGPGDHASLPPLPFYDGPVLATAGIEGQVEWQGEPLASWSIPIPSLEERADLWTEALGGAVAMSATLAATHRSGSHRISSIAHLAQTNASLANANVPDETHVNAAARLGEGTGLDGLAQRVTDEIPDAALVTTPELQRELNHLLARCRARDGLADGLGLSASTRYHPGVKALFTGASGTGKTLAAGWLATRLGLPLYRVDLASVTSKYIGETEKNLGRLLGRAEHAGVILLFDEADSLFGRRTDVKDSNDRYANGQTNYLLQRLESADLIALLTSNSRSRIDSAFTRRLDMIVEFPLPGPEERRSLWQSHLGEHSHLSACELNQLSSVGELCGGHIRNIVLSAAVLARSAKRKIVYSDALQALSGELRKLGRSVPADLHKAS